MQVRHNTHTHRLHIEQQQQQLEKKMQRKNANQKKIETKIMSNFVNNNNNKKYGKTYLLKKLKNKYDEKNKKHEMLRCMEYSTWLEMCVKENTDIQSMETIKIVNKLGEKKPPREIHNQYNKLSSYVNLQQATIAYENKKKFIWTKYKQYTTIILLQTNKMTNSFCIYFTRNQEKKNQETG